MIELCNLPKSSTFTLVRIWKNELPIALRYVDLTGSDGVMYPTVSLVANGSTVQCDVITPNMIEQLPTYFVSIIRLFVIKLDDKAYCAIHTP